MSLSICLSDWLIHSQDSQPCRLPPHHYHIAFLRQKLRKHKCKRKSKRQSKTVNDVVINCKFYALIIFFALRMQLKCDYDLKITDLFGVAVSEDRIVVELFCSVDERTLHMETLLTTTSFIVFRHFRVVTLTPKRWMNDSRVLIVLTTYTRLCHSTHSCLRKSCRIFAVAIRQQHGVGVDEDIP